MKKLLLFSLAAVMLCSCKQSSSPKEVAQAFIKAVYTADLTTASGLISSQTKAVLDKAKKESRQTLAPEETFRFSTLTESMAENNADVKNEVVSVSLVKEEEGWKVVLDENLLNEIENREESLATAKIKWETLKKEYEARMQVAKEYIRFKKGAGTLSPQAKALNDLLDSVSPPKEWTKETLLAYVQKQQLLNKVIDDALEPSLAANTDMTMNYFLQISHAGDRIKNAERDYQLQAIKTHSPVHVPLPFKAANSLQVNNN